VPRRLLIALTLLCAALVVALTGCGGGGKGAGAARAELLSYFPPQPGVLALVATDPEHGQLARARRLAERFPGSDIVLARLRDQLERMGADYERDVRPLLRHDVALGLARPGPVDGDGLLVAVVAPSAGRAEDFIDRQVEARRLRAAGSHRDARLYAADGDTAVAHRDATLLIAASPATLRAALDRHDGDAHLTPERVDAALSGLPRDALLRVIGDARPLLAGRRSAAARRVPWLAALGRFAATVRATSDGVHVEFRADTSAGELADADVPLAGGPRPPRLRGNGPLLVGIRDLAHLVLFLQRAARAADPAGFARFQASKDVIRRRIGVDVDRDVIGQLTGSASLLSDLQGAVMVADLRDPPAMADALRRLQPLIPGFLADAGLRGTSVEALGDTSWALRRGGRTILTYGLAAGRLVARTGAVQTDDAGPLQALARAPATSIPGTHGAVVGRITGRALQRLLGDRLGLGSAAGFVLGGLGDATGWVQATRAGMRGRLDLAVR
jgi:Protein of unknown function (DUF3352)